MNATATVFDAGEIIARPRREVTWVKVAVAVVRCWTVPTWSMWPTLDGCARSALEDTAAGSAIGPWSRCC
jgi:hypothetical protein